MSIKEEDGNGYNLIWVNEDFSLDMMGMDLELGRAKGSLAWTKRILGKRYPCFYYDPSIFTVFHRNGKPNKEKIIKLVYRFGGELKSQVMVPHEDNKYSTKEKEKGK